MHFLNNGKVLLFIALCAGISSSESTLRMVQVIFRHGDRSPMFSYPTDPYKEDAWPQGFGQLTKKGMTQSYELGQFLRKRYDDILNSTYVRSQIYVRSSDKDRALMTATAVLLAMYPASGSQALKDGITWQPVPVHSVPEENDILLYAHCPMYYKLYKEILSSDLAKKIEHENKDLIEYMAYHSGMDPTLKALLEITNPVFCEKEHDKEFPAWLKEDDTLKKILVFYDVKSDLKANTTALIRVKVGALLGEIVKHINDWVEFRNVSQKLFMYSGHDTNIAGILKGLHVYDNRHPYYCSCIMFELHEIEENDFAIKLFYRKTPNSKPVQLHIPGCISMTCSVGEFIAILEELVPDDPKSECFGKPGLLDSVSKDKTMMIVAFISLGMLMFLIVVTMATRHFLKKKQLYGYRLIKSRV